MKEAADARRRRPAREESKWRLAGANEVQRYLGTETNTGRSVVSRLVGLPWRRSRQMGR